MTTGERIKRIATCGGWTGACGGEPLGFELKSAAVRIAQYETDYRVPKEDLINSLADILHASPMAVRGYNTDSSQDIMEALFWLEEEKGYDAVNLTELSDVYTDEEVIQTYNEKKHACTVSPVSLIFQDEKLNLYMYEWKQQKQKLSDGIISADDYFQWKITWPHS